MRVGVDLAPLSWPGRGGIACLAANEARLLAQSGLHDCFFYTSGPVNQAYDPGVEICFLPGSRFGYWMRLRSALRGDGCDALVTFSPDFVPVSDKTVAVLYDLYPLLYRRWLSFMTRNSPTGLKLRVAARLRLHALRRTRAVLCISESTRQQATERLGPGAPPLITTPPGVSRSLLEADRGAVDLRHHGVHGRFILYAGAINQQKDVFTLVRAFETVHADSPDLQLVIAGSDSWPVEGRPLARDGVIRLRAVDDRLLSALYRSCAVFVNPSRYEGFGLPVLEAMAFGAPVLVSDGGALPEVVGDERKVFRAGDAGDLSHKLSEVLMVAGGLEHSRAYSLDRALAFSWTTMAAAIDETLSSMESGVRGQNPRRVSPAWRA